MSRQAVRCSNRPSLAARWLRGRSADACWIMTMILVAVLSGCEEGTGPPPDLKRPGQTPPSGISGRVVSQGAGVAGARVRWKATADHVVTDTEGRFRLPVSPLDGAAEGRTITAAKPGFLIAGSEGADEAEIELERLPERDHPAYAWVDPEPDETASHNCGNCHLQIFQQWKSGAHARAATSRHFLSLYTGTNWERTRDGGWGLLTEYPDGAGVCNACHAPSASLDDLGVADIRSITGVAEQGVHCDFCHKIQDVKLTAVGLTHGRFAMELLRPQEGQLFFGPLDDVDRGEDSYLPLQSESRYCAACHEGIVFGVPVYTTYSEWLESPARAEGRECQSCHMRPNGEMTNFAPNAGGLERDPSTLASHELLPGGRLAMLQRCLRLTVDAKPEAKGIRVAIDLLAHDVGHRVPTGFIDRHLLMIVDPLDANGTVLEPLEGPRLPGAAGQWADRPGVLLAKRLTDAEGRSPVPFWRAGTTIQDTRLEPGAARTTEFRVPDATSTLRVRLLYRPFWQITAQEKQWPDTTLEVVDRVWDLGTLSRD